VAIKAVTFDFWSTLYQNRVVDYNKRLHALKEAVEQGCGARFTVGQFEEAMKEARETWNQAWLHHHRTMSAEEWLLVMLNRLDVSLAPGDLDRIKTDMENTVLVDRPALVPEGREVLASLAICYRLAIISDTGLTPGRILRQLLDEDNISSYFRRFTFSDEVGYSKPHPAAFLITLEHLGVRPEEAVHVGDLLRTDIAGAQQVGMRAVQYIGVHRDEGLASQTLIKLDAIINSHTALEPWLRMWDSSDLFLRELRVPGA
jgi:putative hydrolase of the HAD superfamily